MARHEDAGLPKGQTIYAVEKFDPPSCPEPGCGNEFKESGSYVLVPLVYGVREAREIFTEYLYSGQYFVDLIVCARCRKVIPLVHRERRAYERRDDALQACQEEGFWNLHEQEAFGSMQIWGMQRFVDQGPPHVLGIDS